MPLPEPLNSADLPPFLDNPERLGWETRELQLAIANHPATPRHLLEILIRSGEPQVAQAARLHVNWAGEIAENWQEALDAQLQNVQLGQNDRLAVELLKIAPVPDCFFSEWVPAERFIEGLRNPYLPLRYRLKLLERLAKEPTLEPRLQVAESTETPLAVLEQLAGDLEIPIRLAVKYNSNCPPGLIELVEGQHTVANDWNTDAEQLATLGQSRWALLRLAVAQNPSTPPEMLMQLALDSVFKIQLAVAKNPQTPANVLAVLAEHPEKTIQEAVAEHPNATEEILHQLFLTHQRILKNRKNLPTSILERFFREAATDKPLWKQYELRHLLLRESNTPTWILAELANVDLEELRAENLAKGHATTSTEVVEGWIRNDLRFLADIAKHPQVSIEILERLSQYPSPDVQLAVAQNLNTPEALRIHILEQLVNSSDDRIRAEIALHPETPIHLLEQLANNDSDSSHLLQAIRRYVHNPSENLLQGIRALMEIATPPSALLFWMQQDPAFQQPILQQWEQMVGSLEERELQDLSRAGRSLSNSARLRKAELIPLYGLLLIIGSATSRASSTNAIWKALAGNPNTPLTILNRLQQIRPIIGSVDESLNWELRLALALNSAIDEKQRTEYFQEAIASGRKSICEAIAKNPKTPAFILEQLAEQGRGMLEAIAKNPATPEYLLRQIADRPQPNDYLWRAIAENANAPADLLIRFVKQPHEKRISSNVPMLNLVLQNRNLPILERYRLLLEKEQEQETAKARKFMSRRPNSPYALAEVVKSGDRTALYNAARNSLTPLHILEQLAKHPDETVRGVLLENRNLPLKIRLELTRDPSVSVRCGLAYKSSHRETPVQVLEILADDESEQVREFVAENPHTPIQVLEKLANDPSRNVKHKVVSNQKTPVTILNRLGLEENIFDVRNPNTPGIVLAQAVTRLCPNPRQTPRRTTSYQSDKPLTDLLKYSGYTKGSQMPASLLEELSYHGYCVVRSEVAHHPNTPSTALERLFDDDWSPVRAGVAKHPNTPPQILEQMARREDPNGQSNYYYTVCHYITQRDDTPASALEFLASSPHAQIRASVARNPNTPPTALEHLATTESDEQTLQALIYNSSTTPQALQQLAQNANPKIRSSLIRHPNLPVELWEQLAQDENVEVRCAIASSSKCPISILQTLASDREEDVRHKVATNPNTPANTLEFLNLDVDAKVREAIASNPNTTPSVLEQLAQDEKVEVRRAVAKNPHTPATIRESLRDLVIQPFTRQTSPTLRGLSRIYNPNTDDLPTLLSEYVQSPNAFVRFVTLMHPLTPVDSLEQGFQSVFWCDRYAVADNPSTPVEMRQQLTQDCNRIVRATAKSYL